MSYFWTVRSRVVMPALTPPTSTSAVAVAEPRLLASPVQVRLTLPPGGRSGTPTTVPGVILRMLRPGVTRSESCTPLMEAAPVFVTVTVNDASSPRLTEVGPLTTSALSGGPGGGSGAGAVTPMACEAESVPPGPVTVSWEERGGGMEWR